MRMIARFQKKGAACYVSHLDLLRAMQRAIRRAGLPVKYSSGFNPHQIIAFASAMSVGMASEGECIDVALTEDMEEETFFETLSVNMPPGLSILEAHSVEDRYPALMSITAFADYVITLHLPKEWSQDDLRTKMQKTLDSPLLAMKKGKSGPKEVDLCPWIKSWDIVETDDDSNSDSSSSERKLFFRLIHAPTGALNPELLIPKLIESWGLSPEQCRARILRKAIWAEKDSKLLPLWGVR